MNQSSSERPSSSTKSASPSLPSSGQPLGKAARNRQEFEQKVNEMLFHNLQLSRTLWILVRDLGGSVCVDESSADSLWDLKYEKVERRPLPKWMARILRRNPERNLLKIRAVRMPEISDKQIAEMAERLLGTNNDLSALMDILKLHDYPLSYATKKLSSRIMLSPSGKWITRAEYDKLPKEPPPTSNQAQHGNQTV